MRQLLSIFILLIFPSLLFAADKTVGAGGDYTPVNAANIQLAAAAISPGDDVIIVDGTYNASDLDGCVLDEDGSEGNKLTLRAQTPGGVIITGVNLSDMFTVTGDYWVIKDFHFYRNGKRQLVEVGGGRYGEIYNNKFEQFGYSHQDEDGAMTMIIIGGAAPSGGWETHYNTYIDSWGGFIQHIHNAQAYTQHVHHNYINNISRGTGDSASRGLGQQGTDSAPEQLLNLTFEYNYIENLNAEEHGLINKSSNNFYQYNVWKNCNGVINIRGGDDCTVRGNYFLTVGPGVAIRMHGDGHKFYNNYFENVSSTAAFSIPAGDKELWPDTCSPPQFEGDTCNYARSNNILIANNTIMEIVDSTGYHGIWLGGLDFGDGEFSPKNFTIVNNLIVEEHNTTSRACLSCRKRDTPLTVSNNIFYSIDQALSWKNQGCASPGGWVDSDPNLTQGTYIQRLQAGSTNAIEAGTPVAEVTVDIDGDARDETSPDIGCDEYSGTTSAPILASEVGVQWPAPVISGAVPSGEQACTDDPVAVVMSWTTNKDCDCRIDTTDVGDYDSATPGSVTTTGGTSHIDFEDFACDASYHRYVYCEDPFGQEVGEEDISFSIAAGAPPPPPAAVGSISGGACSGGSIGGS